MLCTSELASTYFPHWIWMGRELRRGRFPIKENIYYNYPGCIPFLSTFYPPNFLTSVVGSLLGLDQSFRFFTLLILGHYLVGSFVAYWMFSQWATPLVSLFGAVTLTYSGYNIKPQTPASAFTCCWIPGMFIAGPMGWISFGMTLLAGYYPPLVYVLPVAILLNPSIFLGILIGLPQVIPFFWYWPKSIRSGKKENAAFGRVPVNHLLDLIVPSSKLRPTNGVHYPEVAMYLGIAPLFIFYLSWWWVPLVISCLVCVGALPQMQRIPARALYLLSLSLTYLALQEILHIHFLTDPIRLTILILIQSLCLLNNASIYPSFPFSQWWDKPSQLYSRYPKDATWPNFTGYLEEERRMQYAGGFCLKENAQ